MVGNLSPITAKSLSVFVFKWQAVMTVGVLGDSKLVYYREQASRYYSASAFLFGLTAAEIPWLLLIAMLHTCIFYPLLGLYPDFGVAAYYGNGVAADRREHGNSQFLLGLLCSRI